LGLVSTVRQGNDEKNFKEYFFAVASEAKTLEDFNHIRSIVDKEEKDEKMGLLYGFPPTAITANRVKELALDTDIPEEVRKSPEYNF
jgi:hypothetical protein